MGLTLFMKNKPVMRLNSIELQNIFKNIFKYNSILK